MAIQGDTPLTALSGVGEERYKKLQKLGLDTAGDLLRHYPRDYEDRRQVYTIQEAPPGQRVCIVATAAERPRRDRIRKGLELVRLKAADHTGVLSLTFFNQGYVERAIRPGEEYVFFGTVEEQGRRKAMTNPIFERLGAASVTGRIMPVYPLTAGLSNHMMAALVRQVLPCVSSLPDSLPQRVRQEHRLAAAQFALENIHFPADEQALALARRRLAFEELFYLSLGLERLKDRRQGEAGTPMAPRPLEEFLALLPFASTGAQRRVMEEVAADLTAQRPMNRLVQGDVGSGKTAVAAFAAWLCAKSGGQTALMAPTEVLAEQHHRSLSALLSPAGVEVGLLTGSMSAPEKRRVKQRLEQGELLFVVGTHALISADVAFRRLTLMVADEQHRFGVAQRAALSAKAAGAGAPHVLVMSATPIPRTLALIIYGDLDVSVIDQLPPGRTPVDTFVIGEDKRRRMYGFVRSQVEQGRQVYIICPAVEESGESEPGSGLKSVKHYAKRLQEEVFPDLRVDILHGKLRPREKEAAMSAFVRGETQVLVATTVVEVGVDVPNASLIVVEDADRFGLSQLHQLRGRVGRGSHHSYCVLITASHSAEARARLRILASTTDGFRISEEDLKLRGPGDFFGSRQHGLPQLHLADLTGDMVLLREAQDAARALLRRDSALTQAENRPVREQVRRMFADTPDIFN